MRGMLSSMWVASESEARGDEKYLRTLKRCLMPMSVALQEHGRMLTNLSGGGLDSRSILLNRLLTALPQQILTTWP